MTLHGNGTWSQEQDELVLGLWAAGESAGSIAVKIGAKSRNAILGRLHRLRGKGASITKRSSQRVRLPRSATRPPPAVRPRPRQALQRQQRPSVEPPLICPKAYEVAPDGLPVSIVELCSAACKWPVTETGPHLFCNKIRRGDGPYCDEHAVKSYRPREMRRGRHEVPFQ